MTAYTDAESNAVSAPSTAAPASTRVSLANVKILTAPGAAFELGPEQRDLMCLTSDGVLHISEAHRNSTYVLAFRERLNRRQFGHKPRFVRHVEIATIYKRFSAAVANSADDPSARQAEVVKIMRDAVEMGASDVHFRIEKDATRILFRVDGDLIERPQVGMQHGRDLVSTIYQSMCDVAQPMFLPNKSQDARLNSNHTGALGLKGARMSTRPTDSGQLAVLRLLYQRKQKFSLEELGFLPQQLEDIKVITSRTDGICIISGPTGAGKSTTLESLLSQLMMEFGGRKNLITIEDPPEYEIYGAVQTPVQYASDATDDEISGSWARAIANLMRLDPDLAMIGEVRDLASAVAAFRAAMTGHGIFTTLHANDVVAILVRLKDMGVDVSLLTDPKIIIGMVSQRLAPRVCTKCRKPFRQFSHLMASDVAKRVERYCDPDKVFLAGTGCDLCKGRGIKGRIVIAETAVPTASFMNEFVRGGQGAARRYWAREMNGLTRNQVLIHRINQGVVDPILGEQAVCTLDEDALTLE